MRGYREAISTIQALMFSAGHEVNRISAAGAGTELVEGGIAIVP